MAKTYIGIPFDKSLNILLYLAVEIVLLLNGAKPRNPHLTFAEVIADAVQHMPDVTPPKGGQ